jgi:hypothetical protein
MAVQRIRQIQQTKQTQLAGLALLFLIAGPWGCTEDPGATRGADRLVFDDAAIDGAEDDAGACVPEGEKQHTVLASPHVSSPASLATVIYSSNPPSSGPHCSSTASYAQMSPIDRCNWLHNLEHGAVVLLYNCAVACPELVAQLQQVAASAKRDPLCGTRRILITADPMLDTRVAAAAWGFTWKSDCFNEAAGASLVGFIDAHIGHAPEDFCF